MSETTILAAAAVATGIAVGMSSQGQKVVKKTLGVTKSAWNAGVGRFSQTEPELVEVQSVSTLPEGRKAQA